MQTTFRLNASELDERFLASVRALFEGRRLAINVSDENVEEEEMNETEFLLRDPAYREHLLRSIRELEAGGGVRMTMEELEELAK